MYHFAENEQIDFVSICLPTHLHHYGVMEAAKRKINILCEKPFASTALQAKEMVDAAKENAKINNVNNVIHVLGDATKETLKLQKQGKFFDYIVVDPPRKGLDEQGIELIFSFLKRFGRPKVRPPTYILILPNFMNNTIF